MPDKMDICFLCNGHEFAINLGILIASILVNSDKEDNFYFHIITNDMSEDDRSKLIQLKEIKDFDIKFYDIDENIVNKYKKLIEGKTPNWWGYHIFLKLEIPNILKDLDKVLSLDVDIIVLKNIKEIFNINIDDYYLLTSYYFIDSYRYFREDGYENVLSKKKLISSSINKNNIDEYCKKNYENFYNHIKKCDILDKKPEEWISAGFNYMYLKKLREILEYQKIVDYFMWCTSNHLLCTEETLINHFIKNDKIKRLS